MDIFLLILAIVALPCIIFWMVAVRDLMMRRDEEFRGQFDKIAWAILLVFTGVLGAIVYFICRPREDLTTSDSTGSEAATDEPVECIECGRMIPAGAVKCSSCGWSYSQT